MTTAKLCRKAKPRRIAPPTEEHEQAVLADWLNFIGVLWCHVPNEGRHKPQYHAKRLRLGVKAGVPDVLIFTRPPAVDMRDIGGVAVELKRGDGSGRLSNAQAQWIAELRMCGWLATTCDGAREAIEWLEGLGYGHAA